MEAELLVRDLDEAGLLARIVPLLPSAPGELLGPGDDAAVIAAPDGRYVITCDVLVEDRHFRREWSSGYDVGWRAAVQNLADVAAMGARPTALVVGLAMPGDLPVSWVEDFARGMADACKPIGAGVVGGDLSSANAIFVSVTALGDLEGRSAVTRSGARGGDIVAHAGVLGHSAAGLSVLDTPSLAAPVTTAPYIAAHLRPTSPLAAGVAAAEAGATAMMDVSDGLLIDAGRMAKASNVVLDLDLVGDKPTTAVTELEPIAALLERDLTSGVSTGSTARETARNWVLTGGEDHGLLATFPPDVELPIPFQQIGTVRQVAENEPARVTLNGEIPDVTPGWDHFSQRTN